MEIVWDGLISKDFVLKTLNGKRNRDFNLKKTLCDSSVPHKKTQLGSGGGSSIGGGDIDIVSSLAQNEFCLHCQGGGTLLICEQEGCRDVAHGECENLTKKQVKALPQYFCPKHRVVRSDSFIDLSFLNLGPNYAAPAAEILALLPPPPPPPPPPLPSIPSADCVSISDTVGCNLTTVTADTTPDFQKISEKLALLSMLLGTSQASKSSELRPVYRRLLELDSLIALVNDLLQQPAHQPVLHPSLFYRTEGLNVQTKLPAFIAGSIPSDLRRSQISTQQWSDCLVEGVGCCHIFHAFTDNLALDAVAIQVPTEEFAFHVNGCLTSLTPSGITFTKGDQSLSLTGACSEFIAWATARQAVDFTEHHFSFFHQRSLEIVECGGGGDCFYHSVLHLLRLYTPEFVLSCKRSKKLVALNAGHKSVTHRDLRTATCQHLKRNFADINIGKVSIMAHIRDLDDDGISDEDVVRKYCRLHQKVGTYVEGPIVWAFAHLASTLQIFHSSSETPQVIYHSVRPPDILCFKLWSDGVHYQVRLSYLIFCTQKSHVFKALVPSPSSNAC
jgi:hypothetical protein